MMHWRLWLAFWLCIIVTAPAQARTDEDRLWLGSTSGTAIPSWAKKDQTTAEDQISNKLRAALDRQPRPTKAGGKRIKRKQILIFHQSGKPAFAVATWSGDWNDVLTIDRVIDEKRLKRVLTFTGNTQLTIVEPSGSDVFPDRALALFVDDASLGSAAEGYSQHIFRLTSKVTEVTPPFRTLWAEKRDGYLMAMSSDDRWGHFFYGCGACGPFVPLISVWRDGSFRPACRQFQELIRQRIAEEQIYVDKGKNRPAETEEEIDNLKQDKIYAIDYLLSIALMQSQLGDFNEARRSYTSLTTWLRADPAFHDPRNPDWAKQVEESVWPAITEAEVPDQNTTQCPLSATGVRGRHPGAERRFNSFR